MESDPDLTIVLLGSTGVGKSASGNTILGREAFESRQSPAPVTKQISAETANVFGKHISVVDTPEIFGSESLIHIRCRDLLRSSGPCWFLVVFKVGPYTKEHEKVLKAASRVLGPGGSKKCDLLFTGGDALKSKSLEEFIFGDEERSPEVNTFSGRLYLLDNENGGQEQVRDLLEDSGHLQQPSAEARRIVLLGLPGAGKSSAGNTILRQKKFGIACGFDSVSSETVSASATVEARQVTVVDTPGFTDQLLSPKKLFEEIMKSVVEASPGPHAFVFVVRIGRMAEADIKLCELLPKLFDSEVCDAKKYSMVLFTHGDELEGRSVEGLMETSRSVSELVSMCGGRYCVFDNKTTKSREQVRSFLSKIDEMVSDNGGQHFTSDMFKLAETFINEDRSLVRRSLRGIVSLPFKILWAVILIIKLATKSCFRVVRWCWAQTCGVVSWFWTKRNDSRDAEGKRDKNELKNE